MKDMSRDSRTKQVLIAKHEQIWKRQCLLLFFFFFFQVMYKPQYILHFTDTMHYPYYDTKTCHESTCQRPQTCATPNKTSSCLNDQIDQLLFNCPMPSRNTLCNFQKENYPTTYMGQLNLLVIIDDQNKVNFYVGYWNFQKNKRTEDANINGVYCKGFKCLGTGNRGAKLKREFSANKRERTSKIKTRHDGLSQDNEQQQERVAHELEFVQLIYEWVFDHQDQNQRMNLAPIL